MFRSPVPVVAISLFAILAITYPTSDTLPLPTADPSPPPPPPAPHTSLPSPSSPSPPRDTPKSGRSRPLPSRPSVPSGCLQRSCADDDKLECIALPNASKAWAPQDLELLEVKGTIFLSMYFKPDNVPYLHEFFYNMLWHFDRLFPTETILLGAASCPFPGFETVVSEHINSTSYFKSHSNPIRADVMYCQELPHPCSCPGKKLYSRCKLAFILAVLHRGFDALWMDSDTALLQNPLDSAMPLGPDEDIAGCRERGYHINTGLLRVKHTNNSLTAMRIAIASLNLHETLVGIMGAGVWIAEQAYVAQLFSINHRVVRHKYARLPYDPAWSPIAQKGPVANAGQWNIQINACRAQNKKHVAMWREQARKGLLSSAHASGGCTRHVWRKKGFLIELHAWYDKEDVKTFFDHPHNSKIASYRYT